MKRILFLFTALFTMCSSVMADNLTATLQQGDKVSHGNCPPVMRWHHHIGDYEPAQKVGNGVK